MSLKKMVLSLLLVALGEIVFAVDPVVAPDNSLDSLEYVTRGLPGYDHVWSAADYEEAVAGLKAISAANPTWLPRSGSAKSGKLFSRIVSIDNLISVSHISDLSLQVTAYMSILISDGKFIAIYGTNTSSEHAYDREFIEICLHFVDVFGNIFSIVDEKVMPLAKDDRTRLQVENWIPDLRNVASQYLTGIIDILADHKDIRTTELLMLAHGLRPHIRQLYEKVPDKTQIEIRTKLKQVSAVEADAYLNRALTDLLELVGR
jgi:hypothetical protein